MTIYLVTFGVSSCVIKMKILLVKSLPAIIDLTWVVIFISIVRISVYITSLLDMPFLDMHTKYVLLGFIFVNVYIIITGVLCRLLVRPAIAGRSKIGLDKKWLNWRLNWHFYSMVFLFFSKYLFYNRTIRYIFLRLMRVNLSYTTYFAETVDLQDANNLLHIGKNSGLGSEVLIATHLAIATDVMIYREIRIGDNSHIQARAALAPGVTIGNNCIVGFATLVSLNVKIGDGTRIGGKCGINTGVVIGNDCRIGDNVIIGQNLVIPDNTIIADHCVIRSVKDINPQPIELSELVA